MVTKRVYSRLGKLARASRSLVLSFVLVAGVTLGVLFVGLVSAAFAPLEASAALSTSIEPAKSANWAGYTSTGFPKYDGVSAIWDVPRVKCSTTETIANFDRSDASIFVGLGGVNKDTGLEQIGTSSECLISGPKYSSWWEMYPKEAVPIKSTEYPTKPGDTMRARVKFEGGNKFELYLYNLTQNWVFQTHQQQSTMWGARDTAECVIEGGSAGNVWPLGITKPTRLLPLANFGSVKFQNCVTTQPNMPTLGIGQSKTTAKLDMYNAKLTRVRATTSRFLNSGNTDFKIDWVSSKP